MPKVAVTKAGTKVDISTLVAVMLGGIAMLAMAGFGFMKTEIEPTIKNNLPGWAWSFQNQDNYTYDRDKVKIENNIVGLTGETRGTIQNNPPFSYGCYSHPAVGFMTDSNGQVNFQISRDNLNWYYWNKNIWQNSENLEQASDDSVINQHIIDFFPRTLDQFYFKAILIEKTSQLQKVEITCDISTLKKFQLYPQSLNL